jgi:outer membrane immunogenic protein
MKKLLCGAITFATIAAAFPAAADVSDEDRARLDALEKENTILRRENAALRGRPRLSAVTREDASSSASIYAGSPATTAMAAAYKAPAAVATSPWAGFYVGVGLGTRSTQADVSLVSETVNSGAPFAGLTACLAAGTCVFGEPFNGTSFRISPYIGYNWQVSPQWVIGIEGDWGWADHNTTLGGMVYPFTPFITGNANDSFALRTTWDASIRGRLGYLVNPSFLLYVTGGAAWLHAEATSNCGTTPFTFCAPSLFAPNVITDSTTRLGWTVGGGIEAMLWSNWIARAEYRHADFGTIRNTDIRICPGGPPCNNIVAASTWIYDLKVRTHTAMFGLAYKFGGPVVAKY